MRWTVLGCLLLAGLVAIVLCETGGDRRRIQRAATGPVRSSPNDATDIPCEPEVLLGKVVSQANDVPVSGASIIAYAFDTGTYRRTTTAEDGTFSLGDVRADGQALQLIASHEGFGAVFVRVVMPSFPIAIRLAEAGGIRGKISAAGTDDPLKECRVAVVRDCADEQPPSMHELLLRHLLPPDLAVDATTATFADGTFEVQGLAPGKYAVLVDAGGYSRQPRRDETRVDVRAGVTTDVDVAVLELAEIPVVVFDEETGRPLDGARFDMEIGVAGWSTYEPLNAVARGAGSYGLYAGVSGGAFAIMRLRVGRDGYARRVLPLIAQDGPFGRLRTGDRIRVALGRGATIDGHVWSAGSPARGAHLVVRPEGWKYPIASAVTAPDGAFEIPGLDVGERLNVYAYDRSLRQIAVAAVTLTNAERRTLEIGAPGTTAIEGHIVVHDAPASNALVTLKGESLVEGSTNADGEYRLEGLSPGVHELRVIAAKEHIVRKAVVAWNQRLRLDINASRTITGEVVDGHTGVPVTSMPQLWARSDALCVFTRADEAGRFRLAVEPGVYQLDCVAEDVQVLERPLVDVTAVARSESVLRVCRDVPKGRIVIRLVTEPEGERLPRCTYEHAWSEGCTRGFVREGGGPLVLAGLCLGVHRIRVFSDTHVMAQVEIALVAGQLDVQQEIVLHAAQAVRVVGVPRDSVAAQVGLRPGDIIVGCNGMSTPNLAALRAALSAADQIRIEYERKGEPRVATLPVDKPRLELENALVR